MLKIRAEAFIVGLFNFYHFTFNLIIIAKMIKLKLTMIKLIYILEVNKIEKRVIKKVMENI